MEWPFLFPEPFSRAFVTQLFGVAPRSPYATRMIAHLYDKGVAFLYGMLFRQAFVVTPELTASVAAYPPPPASGRTFGIHARHPNPQDEGTRVAREVQCLDQLLVQSKDASNSSANNCTVYIMSDRTATLVALQEAARARHWQAVVGVEAANSSVYGVQPPEQVAEHGSNAGAGFFRDLAVVSQARTGFCGYARSSSALVYELMVYEARLEGLSSPPLLGNLGYN